MDFTDIPMVSDSVIPSKSPFHGQQPELPEQLKRLPPVKTPEPNFTVDSNSIVTDFVSDRPIKVDKPLSDAEAAEAKHRGRRKSSPSTTGTSKIIRGSEDSKQPAESGTVEDAPTMYTYMETTAELRNINAQLDAMNSALVEEFASVRRSRTMKNRYNVLIGLSQNINDNMENKISAIKEINSAISKSNELDYKKQKDMAAAKAEVNDDKYIADLYKGFINNPGNIPAAPQLSPVDVGTYGTGIIRANIGDNTGDTSYMNYLTNMTPEQNLMMYEDNPNIKQAVIYNEATGQKVFQYVDMRTNQVIPNMPTYDDVIMKDTYIDKRNMIAKNNNIHETFPLIIVGQDNTDVTSQY